MGITPRGSHVCAAAMSVHEACMQHKFWDMLKLCQTTSAATWPCGGFCKRTGRWRTSRGVRLKRSMGLGTHFPSVRSHSTTE